MTIDPNDTSTTRTTNLSEIRTNQHSLHHITEESSSVKMRMTTNMISNNNDNNNTNQVLVVRNIESDNNSYHDISQYHYPITILIICIMHIVYYYRCYNDWKHSKRQRRRRSRQQQQQHVSEQSQNYITTPTSSTNQDSLLYSYTMAINYHIIIQQKQFYKWWIAIFAIPQQQEQPNLSSSSTAAADPNSTTTTTTTTADTNNILPLPQQQRRRRLSCCYRSISTTTNTTTTTNHSVSDNNRFLLLPLLRRRLQQTIRCIESIPYNIWNYYRICQGYITQCYTNVVQQYRHPNLRHLSLYRRVPMTLILSASTSRLPFFRRLPFCLMINVSSIWIQYNQFIHTNRIIPTLQRFLFHIRQRLIILVPLQQQQLLFSYLLLLYISHLLWSCRIVEWYYTTLTYQYHDKSQFENDYLYLIEIEQQQQLLSTKLHTIPIGRTSRVLIYVRVWIGIAVLATLFELSFRRIYINLAYRLYRSMLHMIIVKREQMRPTILQQEHLNIGSGHVSNDNNNDIGLEQNDVTSNVTGGNISEDEIEQPDIIPYLMIPSSRTSRHDSVLERKFQQLHKVVHSLSTSIIRVNMIQMISSLLMIYRRIVLQNRYHPEYHKMLHGTNLNNNNNDDDVLQQKRFYIYYHELLQMQLNKHGVLSPIPFVQWPTNLLGINISYVACIVVLFWLWLLYDDDPMTTITGSVNDSARNTVSSTDDIPISSNYNTDESTTNASSSYKRSSSSSNSTRYVLMSIIYGTLIGYIWGNMDVIATSSFLGNLFLLAACIGTLLSLKMAYPNNYFLRCCISSVGCNRNGQMLTYDPQQNIYINFYSDDEDHVESSVSGSLNDEEEIPYLDNNLERNVTTATPTTSIIENDQEMIPLFATETNENTGTSGSTFHSNHVRSRRTTVTTAPYGLV